MEIIRVTSHDQLKDCFKVRFKVFVDEQQVPEHLEMDEKDESPEASHHFLILDGEQPVAAARWYEYQPQTAKLQRVAVLKEYRGQSLGKQIILAMEQQARELNCTSSILDAQCQAEGFYSQLGYHVISTEPFYDAGILHVRMKKPL
ncbi:MULTISPECIES: GNAT family N-acetyltransferase [Paenibacillus]|uniref:GNAT family N-acetyltransferase n=1 Tax=Paenibacillus anseongense TaxID=2682845 RepID=A0ABW9UGR5_9BACL|nr:MULTISPECIES: GNAT family N-acetyltransferase [Paenibacillus]MBA2938007.1 GNAT family N-acetyltransferase [Paenibacillus sp. CGMCC 1.16610]MVQ37065.1 GNAT family N-acetyltransferase [Paenibacillus anseongense]